VPETLDDVGAAIDHLAELGSIAARSRRPLGRRDRGLRRRGGMRGAADRLSQAGVLTPGARTSCGCRRRRRALPAIADRAPAVPACSCALARRHRAAGNQRGFAAAWRRARRLTGPLGHLDPENLKRETVVEWL
jgi:hypothetical protein